VDILNVILTQIFPSQWRLIAIVSALLLLAAEAGFRLGLRLHKSKDEARKSQLGGIQGAVLGLLALLLGFTFAMAVARYESRRDLVLREANSIGTTFLRASFLPETRQNTAENLLRSYLDARLSFYAAGPDTAEQTVAEQRAAELQRALWAQAVAAGKENPTPLVTSFVTALNDLIDLDATRLNALRSRIPGAVWLLVLAVAMSGCFTSGYSAGGSGVRSAFPELVLPLLMAVVITLIADLDRPRGGLIGISQQPLIDLKHALQSG
jgi:hypothetical protein